MKKCVYVTLTMTPESPQFNLSYCPDRIAYNCREHGRDWKHTYCSVGMLDCPFDKPCRAITEQDWDAIMKKEPSDADKGRTELAERP